MKKLQSRKIPFSLLTSAQVLGLASGSMALAATTGTVTLSGTVPAATAIVVTGTNNNNLDLTTTANDLAVATVKEINNTANGYTVTMASQNAGKLKNGTISSVTYTAKYNGTSANLSSTPVTVTSSGATTSVVNVTKSLAISYTGTPATDLMQGTYSDTLTFTITAN